MSEEHAVEKPRGKAPWRLGEELISRGLIDHEQLKKALVLGKSSGKPLGEVLVGMGAVDPSELRPLLAARLGVPQIDLAQIYGDPLILESLPKDKAFKLGAIPLFLVENELTVAMSDPENLAKIAELRFITGKEILPVLAMQDEIAKHLPEYYGARSELDDTGLGIEFESVEQDAADDDLLDTSEQDRPAVRLVNLILAQAIKEEASDIHLEPQEGQLTVRFRVDGKLQHKPFSVPVAAVPVITSRIKILSAIDISERRVPQDGKVRVRFQGRRIDVRVSTFPSLHGEKIVMRLLDKERQNFTLSSIGMAPRLLEQWERLMRRKEGIILVTGPTGSGKSSTLYATLRALNEPDINIVTLEDPVEYELAGITQAQVNAKAGYTFAKGLRAILRQDPDIILVGEIRDAETAQIAVQAALTGHLVLATLHTSDAPSTIIRLVDMGVPRYLVAASLAGVLAQRLIRRVCPDCAGLAEPSASDAVLARPWMDQGVPYLLGKGCERCDERGYKGRVGVHELIAINGEHQRLIAEGADESALRNSLRTSGYVPLWWDGLDKAREGQTTIAELLERLDFEEALREANACAPAGIRV